ncbi:MAG: hypothetical protein VW991_04055, partial [Aquiluna sp.]
IPNSWDEFFVAAEKLEAAGIIPLALGEQWTQLHLFETVLLGELGTDAYNGLWDGSTDWGSSAVGDALATFKKVLRAAGTLGHEKMTITATEGGIKLTVVDNTDSTSNAF